jgi:hypothetical protein
MGDLSIIRLDILRVAQRLRDCLASPILILDGASPRLDNPGSMHPRGLALDLTPLPTDERGADWSSFLALYYMCKHANPGGLGVYPLGRSSGRPYLHVDLREAGRQPARWTGLPNGTGGLDYRAGIDERSMLYMAREAMAPPLEEKIDA